MDLKAMATKLQKDGIGQWGVDIFIGHMPEGAQSGILLRGALIGTPIDYDLPNYRKTKFTLAARGVGYVQTQDLAKRASESLTIAETQLKGMDIRFVRPRTEPVAFPINDADLFEFLVIFDAVYVIVE